MIDFLQSIDFVYGWVVMAFVAMLLSIYLSAPYGRHYRSGWGPGLPNNLGWMIMELPALVVVPWLFFVAGQYTIINAVMVLLWLIHYFHRTLIFPFRLRTVGKKIPLSIVLMALVFNLINGVIVSSVFCADTMWTVYSYLGVAVFFIGLYINVRSDYYLISLRKESDSGYQMTRGFLFERISCPNHFGEIIEWLGFYLISLHIGPLTFLLWTMANLIPRAVSHHRWYRQNFEDYPDRRKAIIPFFL